MASWVAALFIGFLIIGLARERSPRWTAGAVFAVILLIIGYVAVKIHAI